jgi:YnbE-like lipoprotein
MAINHRFISAAFLRDICKLHRRLILPAYAVMMILVTAGCSPTIKVEAPDKPIEINLNINISQEVRVKIERDLDNLIQNNPGLF